MHITLRQLQIFLAVAKTENLSTAALDLAMSKSAASQSLADLEAQLEVDLFERLRGRLLLSAEGRRLVPHAEELLERTRDMEGLFNDASRGQLRLATTLSVGNFLAVDLLADFRLRSGWMPSVTMGNTEEVARNLLDFSIDLGLIEGPVTEAELVTEPWMSDEMVVIAPKTHPLAGRSVGWDTLSKENWILREKGSSTRNFFNTQIGQYLKTKNIIAEVNSFKIIVSMLMRGMGISYMSSRVLDDPFYGRCITRIDCPRSFKRQLSFCLHRKKYLSGDLRAFMAFCREWAQTR